MPVDVFRKLSHLGVRAHMGDLPSQHQSPTVGFSVRLLEASATQPNLSTDHKIECSSNWVIWMLSKLLHNSSQMCIFDSQAVAFRALQLPLSEVKIEQERKQTSCCLGKGLLSVLLTENPSTIGRKVVPSVKVPCGNLSLRSSILRQKECWKAPIQSCRKSNPYFLFCVWVENIRCLNKGFG